MSTHYGPSLNTVGIPEIYLDAWNPNNIDSVYLYDISLNRNVFDAAGADRGLVQVAATQKYIYTFSFSPGDNIPSTTINVVTKNVRQYTRLAWFNIKSNSTQWRPLICNKVGNNTDMCLGVDSFGKLHFHQYTKTGTNRTTDGDYGVSGDSNLTLNTWYFGAIAVDRTYNSVKFYLNGKLDGTQTINTIGESSSNDIVIGGAGVDSYSGERMFDGYISQVMHYNRLLSANEINAIYAAFKGRYDK